MVIKIFYFVIALFSVAMVFLSVQTPYVSDIFKENSKIAVMEMKDITDYEISPQLIVGEYKAKSGERFKNRDEFSKFKGRILDDINHTIISDKAQMNGDIITLWKNGHYQNTDNINFYSEKIVYNSKKKFLKSDTNFTMTQDTDKVTGKSVEYDINKKQTKAKGVKGWFQSKD